MGITPLERFIVWFNRPRPCFICDAPVERGAKCTAYCEDEIADIQAI